MFQDKEERTESLLEEAMGLKGMIAEVQSKARLLKARMQREQKAQYESGEAMIPSDSLCEDIQGSIVQMKEDLAKYSSRLKEIHEELARYGVISDIQ